MEYSNLDCTIEQMLRKKIYYSKLSELGKTVRKIGGRKIQDEIFHLGQGIEETINQRGDNY